MWEQTKQSLKESPTPSLVVNENGIVECVNQPFCQLFEGDENDYLYKRLPNKLYILKTPVVEPRVELKKIAPSFPLDVVINNFSKTLQTVVTVLSGKPVLYLMQFLPVERKLERDAFFVRANEDCIGLCRYWHLGIQFR